MIETYGSRLHTARTAKELTLNDLSEMVGISSASLSRTENGINYPRKKTRRAIAKALEVSEEWLETGDGEMEEPKNVVHIEEEIDASLIPEHLRTRLQDALAFMTETQIETAILVCEAMADLNRHQRMAAYREGIQAIDTRKYASAEPPKTHEEKAKAPRTFDPMKALEAEEYGKNEG